MDLRLAPNLADTSTGIGLGDPIPYRMRASLEDLGILKCCLHWTSHQKGLQRKTRGVRRRGWITSSVQYWNKPLTPLLWGRTSKDEKEVLMDLSRAIAVSSWNPLMLSECECIKTLESGLLCALRFAFAGSVFLGWFLLRLSSVVTGFFDATFETGFNVLKASGVLFTEPFLLQVEQVLMVG